METENKIQLMEISGSILEAIRMAKRDEALIEDCVRRAIEDRDLPMKIRSLRSFYGRRVQDPNVRAEAALRDSWEVAKTMGLRVSDMAEAVFMTERDLSGILHEKRQ